MAAIHEVSLIGLNGMYVDEESKKEVIATAFWGWFHSHQDDKVTTVKVWFFSKTVYVRDLRQIFILLFGPEL
jgi:hypothetical protein